MISYEEDISLKQNLHFNYLKDLFKKHNLNIDNNTFNNLNILNNKGKYTNLGLILSDECPYQINFANFMDEIPKELIEHLNFKGSIIKQINDIYNYLQKFNSINEDIQDYPNKALKLALYLNIINTDFKNNKLISIIIFDDRLEIESPGKFGEDINTKYIPKRKIKPYNPHLAHILSLLGYLENPGYEIKELFKLYEGQRRPTIKFDYDNILIKLYDINFQMEWKYYCKRQKLEENMLINEYLKTYGNNKEFKLFNIIEKIIYRNLPF